MLAQQRLQLAPMLAAGIALGTVHSAPMPGQPSSRIRVHVLAMAQVEELMLKRRLRLGIRLRSAYLTRE